MTVGDVFAGISSTQIEGMMFHNDMADYFDFLGLMGFKRIHEYRFLSESAEMRGTHQYYINHCNMLVHQPPVNSTSHIPSSWYNYTRQKVDSGTKRNAVQSAMEKWTDWERGVKKKYEDYYSELCSMKEIAAACKVKSLIVDVDEELKNADKLYLKLMSCNFDMTVIVDMQDSLHEEYKTKEDSIKVDIC